MQFPFLLPAGLLVTLTRATPLTPTEDLDSTINPVQSRNVPVLLPRKKAPKDCKKLVVTVYTCRDPGNPGAFPTDHIDYVRPALGTCDGTARIGTEYQSYTEWDPALLRYVEHETQNHPDDSVKQCSDKGKLAYVTKFVTWRWRFKEPGCDPLARFEQAMKAMDRDGKHKELLGTSIQGTSYGPKVTCSNEKDDPNN